MTGEARSSNGPGSRHRARATRLARVAVAAALTAALGACGTGMDPVSGGGGAAAPSLDVAAVRSVFEGLYTALLSPAPAAPPAAPVPAPAPAPAAPAPAAPAPAPAPAPVPAAPAPAPAAPVRTPAELQATLVRMVSEETGYSEALITTLLARSGLTFEQALTQAGYTTAQLTALSDAELRAVVQRVVAERLP